MSQTIPPAGLPPEIVIAVQSGQEKKAEDLVVLDLSEVSSFTDYFIIMQGNSSRQTSAVSEHIERELRKRKIRPLSVEGRTNGEWILMDYGFFILHIFTPETRRYYQLDKLWGDAPRITF